MPDSQPVTESTRLVLYTTAGCHLCEEAAVMLRELELRHNITVIAVEISENASLVAEYGIRIPVVRNTTTNRELGWPFRLEELASLI